MSRETASFDKLKPSIKLGCAENPKNQSAEKTRLN